MRSFILLSLLPLADCTCTDRLTCMDDEASDGPVAAQALLQVRKKEAQLTFLDQQVSSNDWSFVARIVAQRHIGATEGIGSEAPLDVDGYEQVKATCCNLEMMFFIRRVIDEVLNLEICNEGGLSGFVPWFTCETISQKTYFQMLDELKISLPPLNCAFLAPKGKCAGLDFSQCHGVSNPDQYAECENSTTTRVAIPTDCTPYSKGEVCVGNGPHEDMGAITTLCQCDCLQCEMIKGRPCLLKDCIDLHLVESTRCSPTWPGKAGTCVADQNNHTSSYCVVPVPAGCPPVTLHTTSTTTAITLDCSPINAGEVCVGSGATTTLCSCDCELCEAKLKMLGEHRPCVSSDCLNLHLTDAHACNPTWPGGHGVCIADLERNTSSLCNVPLPPGCLVPTPPPGTTTTTSPTTCDPLNSGEVCAKTGLESTTICECDCIACSLKKGDDCTAEDCMALGFFDVSSCKPAWPGAIDTCDLGTQKLCKIPVPAGCPAVVIPTPSTTKSTTPKPASTTKTITTSTVASTTTTPPSEPATTTITTSTAPAPTTSATTTSLDCSPIDDDKGSVCTTLNLINGEPTKYACDCVKCRHFLGAGTEHCDLSACHDYSEDTGWAILGTCDVASADSMCKVNVPEGCSQPSVNVSCGGHSAVSCVECGEEPGLCHGDCLWVLGFPEGSCLPDGEVVVSLSLDCGDGTLTKNCSLCDEDTCRSAAVSPGTCRMAWDDVADHNVATESELVEKCSKPTIAFICVGLDGRYSYSDCNGCAGVGLYGHWLEHSTLGYVWSNQEDDDNRCHEKATTPNPCAPLDPNDKGTVCFDFGGGSTGECACDCDMCRKFFLGGGPCDFFNCQNFEHDTLIDTTGCMANQAEGTCVVNDGSQSGTCQIDVPVGCPQPWQAPVDCGNGVTAASCPDCAELGQCGGECEQTLPAESAKCYPKGDTLDHMYDCGDGSKTWNCRECPMDECALTTNHPLGKNCIVETDGDGNQVCASENR